MNTPATVTATVTEGSWASVRGGKWHRTLSAKPTFMHAEQSVCGLTFVPLNVTWGERPVTHPRWICKHCTRGEGA